jgi:hypothetical protein
VTDDPTRAAPAPPPAPAPAAPAGAATSGADATPRPLLERLGLGFIALVIAVLFGALSVAALASGEVFLGVMAGIGALMTVWAAASSLRRG